MKNNKINGISKAVKLTGENYFEFVKGKKGIIFFKDYWRRAPGQARTGDHIDLWWGKTLRGVGTVNTWFRRNFPDFSENYLDMSDLTKSSEVLFWEMK